MHVNQTGAVCWITGLSGAGKTTLAVALERRLHALGVKAIVVDGDELRSGISSDLGFDSASRSENVRRAAEIAKFLSSKGILCLVSMISPYRLDRERARMIIGSEKFYEVYLSTPLDVCIQRDAKGLYQKALKKEITSFTGVTDVYEPPLSPECEIDTSSALVEDSVDKVCSSLKVLENLMKTRSIENESSPEAPRFSFQ